MKQSKIAWGVFLFVALLAFVASAIWPNIPEVKYTGLVFILGTGFWAITATVGSILG
jgi:hypothetical protein